MLFRIINSLRSIYWFVFRPRTKGVKCLIENNGEYLLIQTSYSGDYWTIPGGGVRSSETPESAIKREVKEEVGITLNEVTHLGQYESAVEYKKDSIFLYHTTTKNKDFKQNLSEVSKIQWFPKINLPSNLSKALIESTILIG